MWSSRRRTAFRRRRASVMAAGERATSGSRSLKRAFAGKTTNARSGSRRAWSSKHVNGPLPITASVARDHLSGRRSRWPGKKRNAPSADGRRNALPPSSSTRNPGRRKRRNGDTTAANGAAVASSTKCATGRRKCSPKRFTMRTTSTPTRNLTERGQENCCRKHSTC